MSPAAKIITDMRSRIGKKNNFWKLRTLDCLNFKLEKEKINNRIETKL